MAMVLGTRRPASSSPSLPSLEREEDKEVELESVVEDVIGVGGLAEGRGVEGAAFFSFMGGGVHPGAGVRGSRIRSPAGDVGPWLERIGSLKMGTSASAKS